MDNNETKNISFSLKEAPISKQSSVTYDDLVREVDLMEMTAIVASDDFVAAEVDYQTNYLKKDLEHIAHYYGIHMGRKRKDELVEQIVVFEKSSDNVEIVFRRKQLWTYMAEIKNDEYLRKFLIFN